MKTPVHLAITLLLFFFMSPLYATVQFYKVTGIFEHDTLNVRSGPGTNHPIIKALPYNAKGIEIIENAPHSKWVKITTPGSRKLGWVHSSYLKKYTDERPVRYQCAGTEPFWNVAIDKSHIVATIMDAPKLDIPLALNVNAMNSPPESRIVSATDNNHSLVAFIREGSCSDGMSDIIFDYHITTLINDKAYIGCCNALPLPSGN